MSGSLSLSVTVLVLFAALLHTGYYFFLIQQYRVGDLSHVYPLARGLSPLMIAFGAMTLAAETFTGIALLGLVLACAGTMSLAFEAGLPWRRAPLEGIYRMVN